MTQEKKQSELKWIFEQGRDSTKFNVLYEDNFGYFHYIANDIKKEDAKFIVKAANNFHPLLNILKKIHYNVDFEHECLDPLFLKYQNSCILCEIEQAIKAAEEGV